MRVIICGAGIGGLTLAQALRNDCDVLVIERDAEPTATGGYRLAINGPATAVLSRHLSEDLMRSIRAVSDGTSRYAQFTIANSRLQPMLVASQDPTEDRLLAQRRALRLLLTRGIEDRIVFSATVQEVEETDEAVSINLRDGRRFTADLVVGAEGAASPTVRALTGADTNTYLGLVGIAGSTPRRDGDPAPPFLARGPGLAFDAGGVAMFLSATSTGSGTLSPKLAAAVGPPSVVWGLIAPESLLTGTERRPPDHLVAAAAGVLARWHPWLVEQVRRSDLDRVAAFAFRAADPKADLTPWPPGRITALGDAVHAMPPTGGQAASTAILDAGYLADRILDHRRDGLALHDALGSYHAAMPSWARPAVRESLGPVRVIYALRNPLLAAAARPALALAGQLRRALLRPRGSSASSRRSWPGRA